MATALGVYVTLAQLKARTGNTSVDATRDAILTEIVDETNQWVEAYTGRVMGPVASAVYTFDGGGPDNPDRSTLDLFRLGVRAVTLLETATTTGGAFTTVASTEYFLRPLNLLNGEPATQIVLNTGTYFYRGYGTIKVTMTAGFAAVPDDVRAVALNIATRAWHGRQSGMTDIVGSDETGAPIVTKIVAPEFKHTLDRYRSALVA
jgi:hypothetical protein